VVVAAANSAPGGALAGYAATTPEQHTDTVLHDNVLTYDFGYRGTGSLGDRVWFDRDGDGFQDAAETGLNGVVVELHDSRGSLLTKTTTDASGAYLFSNLPPGSYSVVIVTSTLPADAIPTYDLDGTATPGVAVVTLAPNQSRTDVDFGYRGSLCDFAPAISTPEILDRDGKVVGTALSAGDGSYLLPDLPAGSYRIRLTPPGSPRR
jgi:hypothetical protein